jgi:hypothetical protein
LLSREIVAAGSVVTVGIDDLAAALVTRENEQMKL